MAEEVEESGGSVIIKRVKKVDGHGAHGGAWKIAYADFVTAMMAFFLLLWLLNSVTQEQLEGISNYFAPASTSATTSGAGGVLGGQVLGEEGSQQASRAKPSVSLALPPPKTGLGGDEVSETPQESEAEATERQLKEAEEKQFQEAQDQLQQAIQQIPEALELTNSLVVDNTPEGLRIQIIDQEGLAMFSSGGSDPLPRARQLLTLVKGVVEKLPQKIAISGHTDAVQFGSGSEYTNWELSVDRANAARRVLRDLGLPVERLSRVVGKAATEPLIEDDPRNARNRRLSIVLLRGTGERPNPEDIPPVNGNQSPPPSNAPPGLLPRPSDNGAPPGLLPRPSDSGDQPGGPPQPAGSSQQQQLLPRPSQNPPQQQLLPRPSQNAPQQQLLPRPGNQAGATGLLPPPVQ